MAALADPLLSPRRDAPRSPELRALLARMSQIAASTGMGVTSCASEEDLSATGVLPGACIEADLLGPEASAADRRKDPGQRPHCRCVPSRDIGIPDTCLNGCVYCYATRNDELARKRHARHDPLAPQLVG
jgi:hypothetical protein